MRTSQKGRRRRRVRQQCPPERSGNKDWQTPSESTAFLAGERLTPSEPTEGASGSPFTAGRQSLR